MQENKGTIKIKKRVFSLILAILMVFSLMPQLDVKADGDGKTYLIYATVNEEVWSDYEIIEDGNETPDNKVLVAIFVNGGAYTYKNDYCCELYVNNANVTVEDGANPGSCALSGNSKIDFVNYTIISENDRIAATTFACDNAEEVVNQYHDSTNIYSYTVKSDFELKEDLEAYDLKVKEDVTLIIADGYDENENKIASTISVKNSANVDGMILICNSEEDNDSNKLYIEDNATLTVGSNGNISGEGNAILGINNGNSNGLNLYNCTDGVEYTSYNDVQGTNYENIIAEFKFDSNESLWTATTKSEAAGMNIDLKGATAKYTFGDSNGDLNSENGRINYSDIANYQSVNSFTMEFTEGEIYGVKISYNSNNQDYISYKKLDENKKFSMNKPEDGWPIMNIEAIDWEDCLYDNEYRCCVGADYIDSYESNTRVNFTTGQELTFTINNNPYKVLICPSDGEEVVLQASDNSYKYTPSSSIPFEIKVYMTEADEAFDSLHAGDGETEAEYTVIDSDASNYVTAKVNNAAIDDAKKVTNGNRQKIVFDNNYQEVVFEITTDYKHECEIYIAEQSVTDEVYNNAYTWSYDGNNDLEFRFKEKEADPKTDYQGAKEDIESAGFAYFVKENEDIAKYIKAHLWDAYFGNPNGHEAYYYGMFASKDSMEQAVTLSGIQKNDGNILNKEKSESLPYYEFSIKLYDDYDDQKDIVANGRVYILEGQYDVVAKFTDGNDVSYDVQDCSKYCLDGEVIFTGAYTLAEDEHHDMKAQVEFFGNGADLVATFDSDDSEKIYAGHMTLEHFPTTEAAIKTNNQNFAINAYVVAINKKIDEEKVVSVTGNTDNGEASAWGWSDMKWHCIEDTTASNPLEIEVYVGSTEININQALESGTKTISAISCDITNASKAVEITKDGNNNYTVKMLSNFYNDLPLTVSFSDGSKGYIQINRVALDINAGSRAGDAQANTVKIMHGTDHNCTYNVAGDYCVYGSFYYPNNKTAESNGRVNLAVTYTWNDGSITRKIISPENADIINPDETNNSKVHVDDYILWSGDEDDAPAKIEAAAVVTGSSDNVFKGALIGSGAGILWEKPQNSIL